MASTRKSFFRVEPWSGLTSASVSNALRPPWPAAEVSNRLQARNCLPHIAGSSRYNFRDHFTAFRTTQRGAHREGLRMQLGGPAQSKSWRLGFWSLIATQFQGAFNDNGLKFFVIYLILGQNPSEAEKDFGVFVIGN